MAAGTWNLIVQQGEQWVRYVDVTDSSGAPVTLTAPATMDVRKDPGAALVLRLSNSNSRITLASNRATLTLTDTDTKALPAGQYVYDLIVGDPGSHPAVLLAGTVRVVARVTKPELS